MSDKKGKFKEAALEVLIELLAFALFFGLGALILHLFSKSELAQMDPELIALVGIGAVLAAAVAVIAAIYLVKRLRRVKGSTAEVKEQKEKEENDHQ